MFWLFVQGAILNPNLGDFWVVLFLVLCVDWFGMPILLLGSLLNPGSVDHFGSICLTRP